MSERLTQVTVIQDKRSLGNYRPGEIGQPFQQESTWYIACPECGGRGSLANHQITENDDATLTISPSLLCYGSTMNKCSAHYFVERNQIRWC
jgi:hypothetical protein